MVICKKKYFSSEFNVLVNIRWVMSDNIEQYRDKRQSIKKKLPFGTVIGFPNHRFVYLLFNEVVKPMINYANTLS